MMDASSAQHQQFPVRKHVIPFKQHSSQDAPFYICIQLTRFDNCVWFHITHAPPPAPPASLEEFKAALEKKEKEKEEGGAKDSARNDEVAAQLPSSKLLDASADDGAAMSLLVEHQYRQALANYRREAAKQPPAKLGSVAVSVALPYAPFFTRSLLLDAAQQEAVGSSAVGPMSDASFNIGGVATSLRPAALDRLEGQQSGGGGGANSEAQIVAMAMAAATAGATGDSLQATFSMDLAQAVQRRLNKHNKQQQQEAQQESSNVPTALVCYVCCGLEQSFCQERDLNMEVARVCSELILPVTSSKTRT